MGDAPVREADAAQAGQQLVRAAPHMQDDRQAEALGQLELLDIEMLLRRRIQARHEEVQADFADRHQARVDVVGGKGLGQLREIARGGAHHVERMDAQRVREALAHRQQAHGVEVGRLDGRDDDLRDPRATCPLDHRVAVSVELGRVEMAVGVDPHCPLLQRKTIVRLPFSSTRCSACHWMARASATHSMSRPMPTSWSGV
mmetsp:Transcript_21723/g.40403  ORF Transcript_21723/g.40403 Transcript_21723/m.40403 type:complete len:201 (+) Transcript_21723:726-1328(+)